MAARFRDVEGMTDQDLTRILNDRLESRLKGHRYASTPAERIEFQGALTELEIIMNELKVEYQARAGEAVGEGIV